MIAAINTAVEDGSVTPEEKAAIANAIEENLGKDLVKLDTLAPNEDVGFDREAQTQLYRQEQTAEQSLRGL